MESCVKIKIEGILVDGILVDGILNPMSLEEIYFYTKMNNAKTTRRRMKKIIENLIVEKRMSLYSKNRGSLPAKYVSLKKPNDGCDFTIDDPSDDGDRW